MISKSIMSLLAIGAGVSTLFAAPQIRQIGSGITMKNSSFSSWLPKAKNYPLNLSVKGSDGKNVNLVMYSRIWYHGRSGNFQNMYQDKNELENWKPKSCEIKNNLITLHTGDLDYDVYRYMEMFEDVDTVKLEYKIGVTNSREIGRDRFQAILFNKEVSSISFDKGDLTNFVTKNNVTQSDIIRSSALLLHYEKYGKTLLVLMDLNLPLEYGRKVGLSPCFNSANWNKNLSFTQLWHEAIPYLKTGEYFGIRVYFHLLEGGKFQLGHREMVKKLATRFKVVPPKFNHNSFDNIYKEPSKLAANIVNVKGVWFETPMKRVYPNTVAPKTVSNAIKLESAANERESIQLVFSPDGKSTIEKITFSDLIGNNGKRISSSNLSGYFLEYQKVADPVAILAQEVNFADKMVPVSDKLPLKLSSGTNTVLHITAYAPVGTTKGVYKGTITLQRNGKSEKINLELKVWGFELPKLSAYKAHGLIWNSPQNHRDEVLKYFAQCNMSGTAYYGGQKELKKYFDGSEFKIPDNFALAEKALKSYNMPLFQAPYAFMGAWDWKPGMKVYFLNLDINSKEFDEKFANYLKSFHRQMKEKGLVNRTMIYLWDEGFGDQYKAMEKTHNMVRKYAPGVKILTVAAPDPAALKFNDIIVLGPFAQWGTVEADQLIRREIKNGKEFWLYMNGVTFGTNVPAVMPRLTPWICYVHGYNGFLQWSMDYNWKYGTFASNGQEWMIYPSKDKPVFSVRMEYFRDGIEDFNMMQLTKKLPANVQAALVKEILSVTPLFGKTQFDPVKVTKIRRKIAAALEK